ncbi:MAG TPA: ribose-5-phosphate isomerase RpiA [Bacillota bacterium]
MKNSRENQELKKIVGRAAAGLVRDGMTCGIGTGSTVAFFIEDLGRRVKEEGLHLVGVPTSFQSKILCRQFGIDTADAQDFSTLDLVIDGADEVDPELNLIKGGGAAQTIEKIIASMGREFVVIVDQSKTVDRLGSTFPVPIEIIPAALALVSAAVRSLGGEPRLRMGQRKDGPVITDNGQFVLDARFDSSVELRRVDAELHRTPGVVETGLFFDMAAKALVGSEGKPVRTLVRKH